MKKLEGRKVWTIALAEEEGLLVERHNLEVILAVEYTHGDAALAILFVHGQAPQTDHHAPQVVDLPLHQHQIALFRHDILDHTLQLRVKVKDLGPDTPLHRGFDLARGAHALFRLEPAIRVPDMMSHVGLCIIRLTKVRQASQKLTS